MPQGTEKKNKSLFHLWISDLSSPQLKIRLFLWNTLVDTSLWAKKWMLRRHPQEQQEKTAGSARHDPAPTLKTRQKLKHLGVCVCVGGDCYLSSTYGELYILLAFNGLFLEGCQSASQMQILFIFSKLQKMKLKLGKEQRSEPLPRGVAKSPPSTTGPDMTLW